MDKISGILPANSRVTTVDMRNSGVSRSGSPSFGRPIGVSTVAQRRADLETTMKADNEFKGQMNIRNVEGDPKAQIVQKLADDFFNKKAELQNKEIDLGLDSSTDMSVEVKPVNIERELTTVSFKDLVKETDEPSSSSNLKPETTAVPPAEPDYTSEKDDNAPATGYYLDVRA